MKPQIISVRGETYFICDYTGAPITKRFYVPSGKHNKGKEGCYATLPILLRHELEKAGLRPTEELAALKRRVEEFYHQPDIPYHTELTPDRVPLSRKGLEKYLMESAMGLAWLDVPKGESVEDISKTKKLKR